MKTAPRFFTAFSINRNACPADQLKKKSTTKKPQNNTTISSLQHRRQSCLWCCPSFCAPALGEPAVSNPKHVAMLFLMGRSRSQLSGELQREHGVCTMIGQMDALLLLSLKEMKAHLWKFHQGGKKKKTKKEGKGVSEKTAPWAISKHQRKRPPACSPHLIPLFPHSMPAGIFLAMHKRLLQPMDSSASTHITCLPLWLPHAVTSDQSKFILYGKRLLQN